MHREAVLRSANSLMKQFARPCRAARTRTYRDGDRRRPSSLNRRSSSASAEKGQATIRISSAWGISLTSRSNAPMRSRSSVLTPSRTPRSTSSRFIHFNSVCGVHPIIGAIGSIAAHVDGYSLRCSRTRRITCTRTSAENLLGFLFMAPFSQMLVPTRNPVRFKATGRATRCLVFAWFKIPKFVAFLATYGSPVAARDQLSKLGITVRMGCKWGSHSGDLCLEIQSKTISFNFGDFYETTYSVSLVALWCNNNCSIFPDSVGGAVWRYRYLQ